MCRSFSLFDLVCLVQEIAIQQIWWLLFVFQNICMLAYITNSIFYTIFGEKEMKSMIFVFAFNIFGRYGPNTPPYVPIRQLLLRKLLKLHLDQFGAEP